MLTDWQILSLANPGSLYVSTQWSLVDASLVIAPIDLGLHLCSHFVAVFFLRGVSSYILQEIELSLVSRSLAALLDNSELSLYFTISDRHSVITSCTACISCEGFSLEEVPAVDSVHEEDEPLFVPSIDTVVCPASLLASVF